MLVLRVETAWHTSCLPAVWCVISSDGNVVEYMTVTVLCIAFLCIAPPVITAFFVIVIVIVFMLKGIVLF